MKKAYLKPMALVTSICSCQILTSSDDEIEINYFTDKEESLDNALSNRRNCWGDDDD